MITPSFALTATERVLPKLALDFTTASLDSRVTFTRSGNTATVVNSSGIIAPVLANVPRFDFDPITLVCKGLLIEEARANLLTNTTTFATTWIAFGSSLSTGAVTAPDGSATSIRYVESSGVAEHGIFQTTATTGSHAYSVFAKINGRRYLVLRKDGGGVSFAVFDLQAGAVTQTQNSTATIQAYGNGWYRCNLVTTVLAVGNTIIKSSDIGTGVNANSTYNGDGVSGFYLYGAQLENGAFQTSYIPTTVSQVTRNADVATMTGANFSDWYTATTGAATVWAIPQTATGTRPLVQFDDTTANEIIALRGNVANPELYIVDGGAPQAQIDAGTIVANTAYKVTGAWNTNSCAAAQNGAAAVTDNTATIPTPTQLRIGSDGTNYASAWIQEIMYWPQRIINAEVEAFSK